MRGDIVPTLIMNLSRFVARVALLCVAAAVGSLPCAAQPIVSVSGSPFEFAPPDGGGNSNVVLVHPSGQYLYVTNDDDQSITVLNVGPGGFLTPNSVKPTSDPTGAAPMGLAMNPEGTRLYVMHRNSSRVSVFSVDMGGVLTELSPASTGVSGSRAYNGITYWRGPLGKDFVFVNNNHLGSPIFPNRVTVFEVIPLTGELSFVGLFSTGHFGASSGTPLIRAAKTIVASDAGMLYVFNRRTTSSITNFTASVTRFVINPLTGALSSPVNTVIPGVASGTLALDPAQTTLYAGRGLHLVDEADDHVVRYFIDSGGLLSLDNSYSTGAGSMIDNIAINPANTKLIATAPFTNKIAVLDPVTMTPLPGTPVTHDRASSSIEGPAGLSISPSGQFVFVGNANGDGENPGITIVSVYALNSAPQVTCPELVEADCGSAGPGQAEVTISADVSDEDGDALTVTWTVDGVEVETDTLPSGGPPTSGAAELTHTFGVGVHTVEAAVSDGKSEPVVCTTTVVVRVELSGLLSPMAGLVPAGGTPPTPTHAFKLGRTVPLKLNVLCGTSSLSDADVSAPCIVSIARNGDALNLSTIDPDAGSSNDDGYCFRYSAPNWVFNLKTTALVAGTYTITIRAPDGRLYDAAFVLR